MQLIEGVPGETEPAALARVPVALENLILSIDALDAEGRGVARSPAGKVVFVEGALPGERVACRIFQKKAKFDVGRAIEVLTESAGRRAPRCPHFGVCGGCATQHADAATQMAAKQRGLEDNLQRIGKVTPETILPIVYGEEWGYRRRARLSVRRVEKKGGVMVGFRERRSTHVADMRECHVLPPHVSALIPGMKELVEKLSIRERVPQIEVAVGDNATALVFRHLLPLSENDLSLLRRFGDENNIHVWLQPRGPDSAHPFHPESSELYYELPEFGLRIRFAPTDFTQVNHAVNRILVSRAVRLLDPQSGERIADLFCGLGNFSLPIATRGAQVVGFEGSRELVETARRNAAANNLVVQFEVLNLFENGLFAYGKFEKLLLDPPREGAIELVKSLPDEWPRRIVYVSCDQATLARDAGVLVHTKGLRLAAAGVANMFPHTAHVESIAVFER
ncbi:MAG TPA: 23S rRNA (uracil(1939)-C(5))-methyltransferase RlmD [Burkholderiales bacterium]|nr:23S rRNA (uracil(1939)-C(5))-methyltransferase RlmD [Burkholderiales bacterium]